jgi:hypothetical protein
MVFSLAILVIHLVLGYWFCSWVAAKSNVFAATLVKAAITFLTSLISIPLTVTFFAYTPGLKSLPGSFMEGALFVTFPLFFGSFTVVYYFIAKFLFRLANRHGYVSSNNVLPSS